MITRTTTTETWLGMLSALVHFGHDVAPMSSGANFKGRTSREVLGYQSVWDMADPIIRSPARKLGYRFMTAEAAWTLSGSNRLAEIKPFGKNIARFTDDGIHMQGAYGPPFIDQVSYIIRALDTDRQSRQAVATIWRPRPGPSNDTPCTVALQWIIRNDELHCIVTMRSSDAWTGVPYDIFNYSMMTAYVALSLRCLQHDALPLSLGKLYLTAGSQHLYRQDQEDAANCLESTMKSKQTTDNASAILQQLPGPQALVEYLWTAARDGVHVPGAWLSDVCPEKVKP